MRRLIVWTSLCILLLGSTLSGVKAEQISIVGDSNSPNMLMDISLRDADLNEVLAALFNTTGGKYQLQVGNGVVGRIPRLQLIQTPFDKALDAILGTEYSYTRQAISNGSYLYRISGRGGSSSVPDTNAMVPSLAPTTPSVPISTSLTSSTTGVTSGSSASSDTAFSTILTIKTKKDATSGTTGTTGTTTGAAATTETSFVKIIKIYYLDIPSLSSALGGTAVSLFVQSSYGSNGGNGYGNGMNNGMNNGYNNNGYNNNSNGYNNNSNGYNNNGYNNNEYNNNNYNNNNNNNNYNNNNRNYNNNNNYNNNSNYRY